MSKWLLLWWFCGALAAACTRELSVMDRDVKLDQIWVDAIFSEAGCTIRHLPNAERIIDRHWALKTGQVDFLSAGTPLAERLAYSHFSAPYTQERIVLVAHKSLAQRLNLAAPEALLALGITVIGPHFGFFGDAWQTVAGFEC